MSQEKRANILITLAGRAVDPLRPHSCRDGNEVYDGKFWWVLSDLSGDQSHSYMWRISVSGIYNTPLRKRINSRLRSQKTSVMGVRNFAAKLLGNHDRRGGRESVLKCLFRYWDFQHDSYELRVRTCVSSLTSYISLMYIHNSGHCPSCAWLLSPPAQYTSLHLDLRL
jgi:hypothetical protein